jgi:hypothetical protein
VDQLHTQPNPPYEGTPPPDKITELDLLIKILSEKELELSTLENQLWLFEIRFAQTVGGLYAELDEIEKEIAKELLRLHPDEEYRKGYRRAEEKAKASQDSVREVIHQSDQKPFRPSEKLKNLYFKVAKTIHPDLSADPNEREYRHTLMTKANEAFKKGDIEGLEKILNEWDKGDRATHFEHKELAPLDQLNLQIRQVKGRIEEIIRGLAELKKTERYQLMVKVEKADQRGVNLLVEMAKNVKDQIIAARKLLSSLQQTK